MVKILSKRNALSPSSAERPAIPGRRRRPSLRASALSVLALLLVFGGYGCHHEEHEEPAPQKLLVTSPLRRTIELTRDYVAQIRAQQHIELRSQERGYLQEIFVDEGQKVTAGQRMFRLMPVLYDAEVQQAQAEAAKARIEYDNTKILADKNVVSAQELALSKAALAKAEATLALAAKHKGLTEIRAPFSGIMTSSTNSPATRTSPVPTASRPSGWTSSTAPSTSRTRCSRRPGRATPRFSWSAASRSTRRRN